jgi:glycosyltransferase involved in cell wall biosynthesis
MLPLVSIGEPMHCPTLTELPPPPPGKTGWPWTEESPKLPDTMPDPSTVSGQVAPWPRVSIVTPSYNQGQFIEETIRSVLLQGYPNLEYIIIDGGSTDGSVEIIRKYEPWLAYWVSEPDKGQSDAINRGFQRAHGEIFAWLNCDDTYLPGAVRTAIQSLTEYPDTTMVYGGANYVDDNGKLLRRGRSVEFDLDRPCESIIPQPAAFFRKAAFEEVGRLDVNFHYRMDLDLWVRMALKFKMQNIPYAFVNIRVSLDTKTTSLSEKHWKELSLIGERYGLKAVSPEYVLQRRARKRLNRGIMLYEAYQMREARGELLEAIRLHASYLTTLKAIALLITSFFGAGLVIRTLSWKRRIYNCRSDLQNP